MTESSVFFDEVLQVFLSDGNFHLVLGAITGDVTPDGKDIKKPVLRLIIPQSRMLEILPDLNNAINDLLNLAQSESRLSFEPKEIKSEKIDSYSGDPLIFKI